MITLITIKVPQPITNKDSFQGNRISLIQNVSSDSVGEVQENIMLQTERNSSLKLVDLTGDYTNIQSAC